jgi:hypothetical protein
MLNIALIAHIMWLGPAMQPMCAGQRAPSSLRPDHSNVRAPRKHAVARRRLFDALSFDYNAHLSTSKLCQNSTLPPYIQPLSAGQRQMCPGLTDTTVIETVRDCGSMWLCSLSPSFRELVIGSRWYNEWSARHIPGTDIPFLMPMQKAKGYPHHDSELIHPPADGGPPVFPPWPERKNVLSLDLNRYKNGDAFETCRRKLSVKLHWYCTHLAPQYNADHHRAVKLMMKAKVFERQDVRLVFDLAGSTGTFCGSLHDFYGDRIVCITGDTFATPQKPRPGQDPDIEWPAQRIVAARGLPSVMIDAVSFLPFGESTLDALHTSWFFHHGVPWTSLWEMYRVLRPGGFLIMRSFPAWMTFKMWPLYLEWAKSMRMRNVFFANAGSIGSIQIFQMPLTKEWLNETMMQYGHPHRPGHGEGHRNVRVAS